MDSNEKHLVFRVKDQLFSVKVENVNTIIQLPKVFKVPQAPEYIIGVINVSGDVIPVVDMGIKISMKAIEKDGLSQIIILQYHNEEDNKISKLGFLVDEVMDVADFDALQIKPLPTAKYHFDERIMKGMHKLNDEFVMQIHVENLFKEDLENLIPESLV